MNTTVAMVWQSLTHRCKLLVLVERVPPQAHNHRIDLALFLRELYLVAFLSYNLRIAEIYTRLSYRAHRRYGFVREVCYRRRCVKYYMVLNGEIAHLLDIPSPCHHGQSLAGLPPKAG